MSFLIIHVPCFQDYQDSISVRGLSPPLGTCCLTLHGSRRAWEVPALIGVGRALGGRPGSHQPAGQTRRGHGILGFSAELSCEPEAQRTPHERQILELAQRFQGPALPGSQCAGPWVPTSALPTRGMGGGSCTCTVLSTPGLQCQEKPLSQLQPPKPSLHMAGVPRAVRSPRLHL